MISAANEVCVETWSAHLKAKLAPGTFSIFVSAPLRSNIVRPTGAGYLQVSFSTLPGRHYQMQFKIQLAELVWSALGENISGPGAAETPFDDLTRQPQRFHRLLALP
jgi:hypothetical protein